MELNISISWCFLLQASEIEPAVPFTRQAFRLGDGAATSLQRTIEADGKGDKVHLEL